MCDLSMYFRLYTKVKNLQPLSAVDTGYQANHLYSFAIGFENVRLILLMVTLPFR
jgi:hypothetical protein